MNLEDFFIKGFVTGVLDKSIDLKEFYQYEFIHCEDEDISWNNPEAENKIRTLQKYFADTYVSKIFNDFEYKDVCMWAGVDSGSAVWHNDFEDGDKFNSNVLVYLDDLTPDNGNKIKIRDNTTLKEYTIYPKKGNFVWLNQQKHYEHKATHNSGNRRVVCFKYLIPALI